MFTPDIYPLRNNLNEALEVELTSPAMLSAFIGRTLEKVTGVISEARSVYDQMPTIACANGKDHEEATAAYFSGEPKLIDEVVTRLITLEEEVTGLLAPRRSNEIVYVPPSEEKGSIQPGIVPYEKPGIIPRAATIKFILARTLGDSYENLVKQKRIVTDMGDTTPHMMRSQGYELIVSTDFNRAFLVCDEEANRTFVFDMRKLAELSLTPEQLAKSSKPELKKLIKSYPNIGEAIVYNEAAYVDRIIASLAGFGISSVDARKRMLLSDVEYPGKAPEGYANLPRIVEQTGIHRTTLVKAIGELSTEGTLGIILQHRYGGKRPTESFSTEQQIAIIERVSLVLRNRPAPREGDRHTAAELASLLGISEVTTRKLLTGHTGDAQQEFNGAKSATTYGKAVLHSLQSHPHVVRLQNAVAPPEDILPVYKVAGDLHISPARLKALIGTYHMPIGTYRFSTRVSDGLAPYDTAYIQALLENETKECPPVAEEEYTMPAAATALSMSSGTTIKKIAELLANSDKAFGDLQTRVAGRRKVPTLTQRQLYIVGTYIEQHELRRKK